LIALEIEVGVGDEFVITASAAIAVAVVKLESLINKLLFFDLSSSMLLDPSY